MPEGLQTLADVGGIDVVLGILLEKPMQRADDEVHGRTLISRGDFLPTKEVPAAASRLYQKYNCALVH